jgi:DNA-binding FrmR family transcriptional regulator
MEYPSMEVASRTTVNRLKRIEGQVRGVTRMLEEDRYCIDILRQIQAVKAALRKVESEVLKQHTGHCVEHAIKSGSAKEQREKFAELIDLFEQIRK